MTAKIVKRFAPLLLVVFFLAPAARAQSTTTRPNILLCIADDMSWAHTSAMGDKAVKTPTFDRVAREGVLFTNAFCSSPSCTPSRAALLTGQAFCRLEEGGNLLGTLAKKFAVYPDLLEQAGYAVGYARKGWDPGNGEPGGRTRNPAGPQFADFQAFQKTVKKGQPFCFWFGSQDPHRPYEPAARPVGAIDLSQIVVPPFLPDTPQIRADIADYLWEIQRFDREVGELIATLEKAGTLHNTLVVITSDNGMPFPRAKCNLYDAGARMPLAVRWPAGITTPGRVSDFVSHTDWAPTFLQAAGLLPPKEMTGRSLLPLLASAKRGRVEPARDRVYLGRERHDVFRRENDRPVGYPMRAVRTDQFLFIRNFHSERLPAGDTPDKNEDNDRGPSKTFVAGLKSEAKSGPYQLAYGLRPAEELYDLARDPGQLKNVAADPAYAAARKTLRGDLDRWMTTMNDPRRPGGPDPDVFDRYTPYGKRAPAPSRP